MKNLCTKLIGLVAVILLSFDPLLAEEKRIFLGEIDGESTEKLSLLTIRLSEKPKWKEISLETHGSFLQLVLPDTQVTNPGNFISGNSPWFEKMTAFQLNSTDAAIRIFSKKDVKKIGKLSEVDVIDNRVLISLDHRAIGGSDTTSSAVPVSAGSSSKINLGESAFQISDHYTTLAGFSLVMFLLLVVSTIVIPRLRSRKEGISGSDDLIKHLSHVSIGTKQRLSLVEVSGQKLLLAVSPDNINLLTAIEQPNQQSSIGLERPKEIPFKRIAANSTRDESEPHYERPNADRQKAVPPRPRMKPDALTRAASDAPTTSSNGDGARFRALVNDDGVQVEKRQGNTPPSDRSVEDVTRMIREKLKNLPRI